MGEVQHFDMGYGDEDIISSKGRRLLVEFFEDAVLNVFKTEANKLPDGSQGPEVHDIVRFVRISHPGRLEVFVSEATEKYQKQFPLEWKRFLSKDSSEIGIPIEKLPMLGLDTVKSLRSVNIKTVEQLAALSDDDVSRFGLGFRSARSMALEYLGKSTEVAELNKRIIELEALIKNGKNGPSNSAKRAEADRI